MKSALLGGMCVMTALCLAGPGLAQAQSSTPGRTMKARDFLGTFGVNVHFGQNGYQNTQAMADALKSIGFPRVRCSCSSMSEAAAWNSLAAHSAAYFPNGLKADVLITGYLNAPAVTLASQKLTVSKIAGLVETLEGPNEINNYGVGNGTHGPFDTADQTKNFPANYTAWARALLAWKQSLPALSKATLIAPTIASGDPGDYAKLPDVSAFVGSGTFHFYAGNGRQPSNFGGGNFSAIYDWYKAAASSTQPVSVSEWGQTTAGRPGQSGCDGSTQAKYILNQMFDLAAKGVRRAYLYQLMDDTSDGDPTGSQGAEAHFGIFDYQWKAKPAAQALANIKNLLADSTTKFTAKVPSCTISGLRDAGAAGSSLSVSKSDGSTVIVVWNEPQIWDQQANTPVAPSPDAVTVRFGGAYAYRVYDPLVGLKPIVSGHASNVIVQLTGSPLLIQIVPSSHV